MIYNKADIPEELQRYFVRAEIGLEPTPEQYITSLVMVFQEVRRVLADDGTLWLNLGDSYNSNPSWGRGQSTLEGRPQSEIPSKPSGGWLSHAKTDTLKTKDLVGIPWSVAFALRADGWYLRSDIIWAKPSPMPESVTDRPTKAHEYLFLLAKSERYYYDAKAIRETCTYSGGSTAFGPVDYQDEAELARSQTRRCTKNDRQRYIDTGRNKRTVWTVATAPYSEAHFATFPPKLIEPCILAGSAKGDIVLDPFAGTATTGLVAEKHGRKFVGIELNPKYITLAKRRLRKAKYPETAVENFDGEPSADGLFAEIVA